MYASSCRGLGAQPRQGTPKKARFLTVNLLWAYRVLLSLARRELWRACAFMLYDAQRGTVGHLGPVAQPLEGPVMLELTLVLRPHHRLRLAVADGCLVVLHLAPKRASRRVRPGMQGELGSLGEAACTSADALKHVRYLH